MKKNRKEKIKNMCRVKESVYYNYNTLYDWEESWSGRSKYWNLKFEPLLSVTILFLWFIRVLYYMHITFNCRFMHECVCEVNNRFYSQFFSFCLIAFQRFSVGSNVWWIWRCVCDKRFHMIISYNFFYWMNSKKNQSLQKPLNMIQSWSEFFLIHTARSGH